MNPASAVFPEASVSFATYPDAPIKGIFRDRMTGIA
jgi:hypothetical protein